MRKLGLIGGTGPESTVEYYRAIVYGVQRRLGEPVYPNLTIESLSVFDVLGLCERGDLGGLTAYLLRGVQSLAAAGAEVAALTGITPHVVFDELAAAAPIPLVSMVETSCAHAVREGYHRVGLLGTGPTMRGSFFQEAFARAGVEALVPGERDLEYVASCIEHELEYGKVLPRTQAELRAIVGRMVAQDGIEAVVLGCTELPMAFAGTALDVPAIDVMRVHVDALVDVVLGA